jgi:hypothetical protein
MVSQRLIKLYYDKLKKPTIIYGLVLHPFMIEDKIRWEYENPNDVSFASNVVEGHLEEMLHDFLTLAGISNSTYPHTSINWSELSRDYCKLTKSDVYINQDIRNKINRTVDGFKTITLDDDSDELIAECFVKDWSIEYQDAESLNFHLDLELNNPKIKNKPVDDDTLQEFIQSFIYCDTSHEQESDFSWEVVSIVHKEKNLFDDTYMFTNPIIGYYDSFGNPLT